MECVGGEATAADVAAATVNAAVAVGQRTVDEDAMWKMMFDEDSERTEIVNQPS